VPSISGKLFCYVACALMHRALLGKSCTHKASAQLNKGILLDFCSWSEKARACQLCTLPLGHLWQHHQMSLLLHDVVLSGRFPFSPFLSWSHCSSKACFAPAKVECLCLVPSAFLPAFALAHLGHPDLPCVLFQTEACHSCKQALHLQWALMLLQTVTWSGDNGWFFLVSQNSATSGAFLASVLC